MTTLFEHGTLANLMAGNMGGTITAADLLKHGSQGLGTFDGCDGEVVILNNEVYQAVSSGKVNHITDLSQKMPFASAHFPKDPQAIKLGQTDFKYLNHQLVEKLQLKNVFAALLLNGTFDHVKIRIALKQTRPYPSLLDAAKKQATFTRDHISGTIVGYYAPTIFGTVTAGGWHLHFISDDRKFAGHLLEFNAPHLSGNYEVFDQLNQHFPVNDKDFRQGEVDLGSLQSNIAQSEGNSN